MRAGEVAGASACLRHPVVVGDRLARQQSGRCWYAIAWQGEHPVGHALLHWRRPVPLAVSAGIDGLPYLEDLFVRPETRGHGVGTSLLAAAARAAAERGHRGMTLAVSVENLGARRLYARLGYAPAGTPPRHQLSTDRGPDGAPHTHRETVLDLVLWLDGKAAQAPEELPPGAP